MSLASWNLLVVTLLFIAAFLVPAFNFGMDPYGVFGTPWKRDSYTMNERYLKVEHILREPQRYNAFLIGSSVMGAFDPWVANAIRPDLRFYNLSFLGGTPGEALETLRALRRNGVEIREVVMGVDVFSFRKRVDTDRPDRRMHPVATGDSKLSWYSGYLFSPSFKPGLTRLENTLSGDAEFIRFDIEGGGRYFLVRNELEMREDPEGYVRTKLKSPASTGPATLTVIDEALTELASLDEWLREENIQARYFFHPVNQRVLASYSPDSLAHLKSRIQQVIGTIPDYSRDTSLTHDDRLYYDLNHYIPAVAQRLLEELLPTASLTNVSGFLSGGASRQPSRQRS